ncbi:MAG: hypothetical protein WKF37_21500 [Bryobacteraceae bacterium]
MYGRSTHHQIEAVFVRASFALRLLNG